VVVDTGNSASTAINSERSYNFALLQPGNYSVTVNAAGFQGITKKVTVTLGADGKLGWLPQRCKRTRLSKLA
jgi:hypothetical protein